MKFDAVFIEREVSLTKQDIADILSVLPDGETFIPLEIEGDASSAMGFITYYAADRIDFLYDKDHYLYRFIQEILNDMEIENMLCVYEFEEVGDFGEPLKILLTRDMPTVLDRLNQPAIGTYGLSNTASILVHEIDPYGERDKAAKPVSKIYGKWISPSQNPDIVNKEFFSDCSVCHASSMDEADTCPHCGAVMMNPEVSADDKKDTVPMPEKT